MNSKIKWNRKIISQNRQTALKTKQEQKQATT